MTNPASRYPICTDRLITNPYEGLIIGNGDLAASVTLLSHEMVLSLGKNDVWDPRNDNISENQALKQDDLIGYEKEYGFEWPENCSNLSRFARWEGQPQGLNVVYGPLPMEHEGSGTLYSSFGGVGPRKVGRIRIRFPGFSNAKVSARLEITNGLLQATVNLGKSTLQIHAFIHKELNELAVKLALEGELTVVQVLVEKEPDYADAAMPLPTVKLLSADSGIISQLMPAKHDVPDFSWHLAAAFPTKEKLSGPVKPLTPMAYALFETVYMMSGDSAALYVGVSTDREKVPDASERAELLMGRNTLERFDKDLADSTRHWDEFWSHSAIELSDRELESVWYRNIYGFACHLKKGAQAPTLCANIVMDDNSDFHSTYVWNHNVQKWYVPALPINHLDWYDVFADLIAQQMPNFEHLAHTIFGLEGVYCDLNSLPFAPAKHSFVNNKWGRALSMTGWLAHMLWQRWEYTRDDEWLREQAYPYLSKAATFYRGYLDKYQKADGDIYPSMRLEEPGWCKGFVGNRNQAMDLIMFRKTFEEAVRASEALHVDADKRELWREAIARVPEIDYGFTEDGQGWYAICKDWDKFDSVVDGKRLSEFADLNWRLEYARTNRWGASGWVVYPGEYLQGDEEGGMAEAVRDMLSRVDMMHPKGTVTPAKLHAISALLPYIRLGLTEKYDDIRNILLYHRFDDGQFCPVSYAEGQLPMWVCNNWRIVENQFQGILCVTEMLLQTQGEVIRLFPYWPKDEDASFERLLARGGFVVSAAHASGKGLARLEIESTVGGTCRVRWQDRALPHIREGEDSVDCRREGRDIIFDTVPSKTYRFDIE